jgi:hypothetical protein
VVTRQHGLHGLHEGDLFVLAGWGLAILSLIVLAAMPRERLDK